MPDECNSREVPSDLQSVQEKANYVERSLQRTARIEWNLAKTSSGSTRDDHLFYCKKFSIAHELMKRERIER